MENNEPKFIINEKYRTNFLSIARDMLENKELLDLTVYCKDQKWEIHSFVAAAASSTIKEFLVENNEREISLVEENPVVVDKLIFFMYNGYLSVNSVQELEVSSSKDF